MRLGLPRNSVLPCLSSEPSFQTNSAQILRKTCSADSPRQRDRWWTYRNPRRLPGEREGRPSKGPAVSAKRKRLTRTRRRPAGQLREARAWGFPLDAHLSMYAILRRAIAPEWASIHCARQRVFSTTPVSLSHIGSEPIALPDSVSCDIQAQDPAGIQHVRISGPLGAAQLELPKDVLASIQPSLRDSPSQPATIQVECRDARDSSARSSWGLARTKLHNAVQGVTTGFRLPVRLVGVGYRANLETKEVSLASSRLFPCAATRLSDE